MFAIGVPTIVLLKNVSSPMYNEMKLISTSSSIILIPVLNTKVHELLELVHKALMSGTIF
jgi:hypothetical protein